MQPDQNPLAFDSNGNLLIPSAQSPNFSSTTGWQINHDGTATFNQVVIRNGQTVSSVTLLYSGTPASGNLVGAMASIAGTDSFGNAYFAGITQYDLTHGTFANMNNGMLRVGLTANGINKAGIIGYSNVVLGGTLTLPANAVVSAIDSTFTNAGAVVVLSGNGTTETNAPSVMFVEGTGTEPCYGFISGALVKTTNNGLFQVWNTPSLGSGWVLGAQSGTYRVVQYRLDAMDNLVISGTLHSNSTTPSSVMFILPAGFIPANAERPGATTNHGGTYGAVSIEIIHTSGQVIIDPVPNVSGTDVYIDVCVPMGNIA